MSCFVCSILEYSFVWSTSFHCILLCIFWRSTPEYVCLVPDTGWNWCWWDPEIVKPNHCVWIITVTMYSRNSILPTGASVSSRLTSSSSGTIFVRKHSRAPSHSVTSRRSGRQTQVEVVYHGGGRHFSISLSLSPQVLFVLSLWGKYLWVFNCWSHKTRHLKNL